VTGAVTDIDGELFIGVNIVTTNGTTTDLDGHFTLNVRDIAVLQSLNLWLHKK
jgi:hypothetical protein